MFIDKLIDKSKFLGTFFQQFFIVIIVVTLFSIIYGIWQSTQQADYLPITEQSSKINIQYSYLDAESDLSAVEIINKNFTKLYDRNIPYQLNDKTYWVKVSLTNQSTTTAMLVLHADNAMLAEFTSYVVEANSSYSRKPTRLISHTAVDNKVFPHVNFLLKAGEEKTFLLKVKSLGPPNIPIVIYTKADFEKRMLLSQLLFGAFIGIMLMIMAYNLVLFFALKDKIYLIYIGYLLSAFIVLAGLNGFGYYVIPEPIQHFFNQQLILFHYFFAIFLLLFTVYFLRFDCNNPKTTRVIKIAVYVLLTLSVFSTQLSTVAQAQLFFSIQPLLYLVAIVLIALKLKSSFSWARFYYISWLPLLAGTAIQPLLLFNKIEYSFLAKNAILIGVLIEVSFMAFALAERMRRNEQDRMQEVYYHPHTRLLKKILLHKAFDELTNGYQPNISVLTIKPEHIDHIHLYMNDKLRQDFFKRINKGLSSLFAFNNAIMPLSTRHEKVCLLENNTLAVLVDNKKTTQSHKILIQSIQTVILELYRVDQLSLPLSAHIGIASFPQHGTTSHQLINRALLGLKQAENKPDKHAFFELQSAHQDEYLLQLASNLKSAIDNQEFELYHQPQIDLKTLRVCGSECLLRWTHPTQGEISPQIFIKIAEDTGLINQLTLWAFNTALQQHQDIIENGNSFHKLSINISGQDISSRYFYDQVLTSLETYDITPDKVIFELTEAATITDNEQALLAIEQFSELGITISIDDFGSGYSSLSHISALPFHELKIDRQFIENVCQSRKRKTIAQTMTQMAKSLGLEVVAEGINSVEDEKAMKAFGCDIGQGYYYAEPMPLMSYLIWLKEEVNGHVQHADGEFIAANKEQNVIE